MTRKENYYPKIYHDKTRKKAISTKNGCNNRCENISNNSDNSYKNKSAKNGKSGNNYSYYYPSRDIKEKGVIYNLNHFCSYFKGMFFESLAAETFLSLIDKLTAGFPY